VTGDLGESLAVVELVDPLATSVGAGEANVEVVKVVEVEEEEVEVEGEEEEEEGVDANEESRSSENRDLDGEGAQMPELCADADRADERDAHAAEGWSEREGVELEMALSSCSSVPVRCLTMRNLLGRLRVVA